MEDKYRRTGRTTRLIDNYIQELFKNKRIVVKDHYQNGNDIHINEFLVDSIMRRLALEHTGLNPKRTFKNNESIITI